VIVYLDDILVYSRTKEEHLRFMKLLLRKLQQEKYFDKFEEVFLHEDIVSLFGLCDLSRWVEDGSRKGESYQGVAFSKKHL
jgi:hypothetical protein